MSCRQRCSRRVKLDYTSSNKAILLQQMEKEITDLGMREPNHSGLLNECTGA